MIFVFLLGVASSIMGYIDLIHSMYTLFVYDIVMAIICFSVVIYISKRRRNRARTRSYGN